jgi:hypothetical protein
MISWWCEGIKFSDKKCSADWRYGTAYDIYPRSNARSGFNTPSMKAG